MPEGTEQYTPPEAKQPLYMLENLMDHNRHIPDEYRELILKQRREYDPMVDAVFADAWKFLYDETARQRASGALREGEKVSWLLGIHHLDHFVVK